MFMEPGVTWNGSIFFSLFESDMMDSLAHETIFIDDNAHNVKAALALGLDGIVFENQEQLRSGLAGRGLL